MTQELNLKQYYKFGLSLLQWMLLFCVIGLILIGVYEYLI